MAFAEFKGKPQFSGLDIIRGLSILLVIWHHTAGQSPGSFLAPLAPNSRHGVALFFIVSGFLITTLLMREMSSAGRTAQTLGRFYLRRAFRLFPLYYAVLLVHVLMVYKLGLYSEDSRQLFGVKLPSLFFYYSNWMPSPTGGPLFQAWSLAAEEQFYLLAGAAMLLMSRRAIVVAAALALTGKICVMAVYPDADTKTLLGRVLLSYQEPILAGVLLACAFQTRAIYESARRFLGRNDVLWLLIAICAGYLCLRPPQGDSSLETQMLYFVMTCIVAASVLRRKIAFAHSEILARIGRVSYGIYLLHMIVISFVKKVPFVTDPYTLFALSVAIVVPIAVTVYEYFELPIIRFYKRRFSAPPVEQAIIAEPALPVVR